jgi:hypothetical protein
MSIYRFRLNIQTCIRLKVAFKQNQRTKIVIRKFDYEILNVSHKTTLNSVVFTVYT